MRILLICSKAFYGKILPIKEELGKMGHEIELPNSYYHPQAEQESWDKGKEEHAAFKASMFQKSESVIKTVDAVLALNFDKNGVKNYIGGATFLELYDAFRLGKKIYFYHELPKGILYDELEGFSPIIINENLDLIQ